MWIRKNQEEIEESLKKPEDNKKNFRQSLNPAIIAFIVTTVIPILYLKLHGDGSRMYGMYVGRPYDWAEIFKLPLYYLLLPFMISLFIFFYKFFTGENIIIEDDIELYICDKCNNRLQKYQVKCACGGLYVDIDKMKWVDDDKNINPDNQNLS